MKRSRSNRGRGIALAVFLSSLAFGVHAFLDGPFFAFTINALFAQKDISGCSANTGGIVNNQPVNGALICTNNDCSQSVLTYSDSTVSIAGPYNEETGSFSAIISIINAGQPIATATQNVIVNALGPISGGQFRLGAFSLSGTAIGLETCGFLFNLAQTTFVVGAGDFNINNQANQQTQSVLATFLGVLSANIGQGFQALRSETVADNQLQKIANGARYNGQAAGDGFDYPWGVWASFQLSEFEDSTPTALTEADRNMLLVGVDVSPFDNWIFGVALGYEDADVETGFNTGNVDITGWTVAPYMGAVLSDYLGAENYDITMDMSLGFSNVDIDTVSNSVGRVTSSTSSHRRFFAGNLSVSRAIAQLNLTGLTGILVARVEIDGFTDSTGTVISDSEVSFGQLRIGGEAAYAWDSFEPYVSGIYEYDYDRDTTIGSSDNNGVRLGLGVRYFGSTFSGGLEYSTMLGRDNIDDEAITFSIRGDF